MEKGFEVQPFLAAVEAANFDMVREIASRTPEDKAMLGWAAANLLSDKLNFRTAAAICYECSPVELEPDVVVKLNKAMEMDADNEETIKARYYAAKALVEHEETGGGVSATVEEAAGCGDPNISGLANECLDVIEKLNREQAEKAKNKDDPS